MHSRVGILVHVAPVDAATRSNQTILKLPNPRGKKCWKALDHPSANASQLKKCYRERWDKTSVDGSQFEQI